MNIKKIILYATLALVVCFAIVSVYSRFSTRPTSHVSASLAIDPNNLCAVVGWSSHVFIAKVLREEGTQPDSPVPRTLFSAEVLAIIKGNTTKEVMIAQLANREHSEVWIEDSEELLQENEIYLFVSRYDEATQSYRTFPRSVHIADDTQQAQLMQRYSKAYENEIPFNSYDPGTMVPCPDAPSPYPYPYPEPGQSNGNALSSTPYPDPVQE